MADLENGEEEERNGSEKLLEVQTQARTQATREVSEERGGTPQVELKGLHPKEGGDTQPQI